jgi:hypothetical protein
MPKSRKKPFNFSLQGAFLFKKAALAAILFPIAGNFV